MVDTRVATLNCDEIISLTDRVHSEDGGTEEQRVHIFELLRKMASVYLEAADVKIKGSARDIPIAFTEPELWLLRNRVTSNEKTSTDQLWGVKLLVKLYVAILAFDSPVNDISPIAVTEPTRLEVQQAVRKWRDQEEADGTNPDDS